MNQNFWQGKKVLVTGHTGFKGSWLSLWLDSLGASVTGFALDPPTEPSLFGVAGVGDAVESVIGDIRDPEAVRAVVEHCKPDIVLHMAAQPIVRTSYAEPIRTYATNVLGTAHLLDALRECDSVKAVVCVTSDKCYRNKEWHWGYREEDDLGGNDPYSSSKACAELVVSAMTRSFFDPERYAEHGVAVASVRAGNVIGGGDWATDRLIPDVMEAFASDRPVVIRNPVSTRPWQHVLEPLHGYLMLAERLHEDGPRFGSQAWNFGPKDEDAKPVEWIVDEAARLWAGNASWHLDDDAHPHEDTFLKLDCSKASNALGWQPKLRLQPALAWIVEWYKAREDGEDMGEMTRRQIRRYESLATESAAESPAAEIAVAV